MSANNIDCDRIVAIVTADLENRYFGGKRAMQAEHAAVDAVKQSLEKLEAKNRPYNENDVFKLARKIARNDIVDKLRKLKKTSSGVSIGSTIAAEDPDREILKALAAAIGKLPLQQRDVIETHFIQGLNIEQTADKLHSTPAKVKRLRRRALKALRDQMRAAGYENAVMTGGF